MAVIEDDDIVTYWFVIREEERGKYIQAYSRDKKLVKAYIDFHRCPRFTLKEITDKMKNIVPIINQHVHDEIAIIGISTKDPEAKKGQYKMKLIQIPMTEEERLMLEENVKDYMQIDIPYGYLNSVKPYLKKKYRDALDAVFFPDVVNHVLYHDDPQRLRYVTLDQLVLFIKTNRANFGP